VDVGGADAAPVPAARGEHKGEEALKRFAQIIEKFTDQADSSRSSVQIQFQGRTYSYDAAKVTIAQAYVIKANTTWTLKAWQEQIGELDPHAIAHMWWIVLAQNGEVRNPNDLGDVPCSR